MVVCGESACFTNQSGAISAYMFMDLEEANDSDLPEEIKEKYTLLKTLGR